MTGYLVDTNIVSEIYKGARCDRNVAAWYAAVRDEDLYVSVLVLGEIRRGAERIRDRDRARAEAIEHWLDELTRIHEPRILPIDRRVADVWGRITARPRASVDSLLAATAFVHGLVLVTRNVADVADSGAPVLNPFETLEGTRPQ